MILDQSRGRGVDQALEAINIRNMVEFFSEEFQAIHHGKPATDVFNIGQRRSFRKHGLLTSNGGGTQVRVTERVMNLIQEMSR